jgi:putative phosphoribosyl transferase
VSGEHRFADRREGGRVLAEQLQRYAGRPDVVVLGLPRGGMPVAAEVASALEAPLDVFVVRKLGVPGHEELAMGAIASGGVRVLNGDVVRSVGIPDRVLDAVAARELETLEARERAYRGDCDPIGLRGRTAILIDDGLATGATMRAAITALRDLGAAAIVVAVPIAPRETCEALRSEVDEVVCARTPEPFNAVGLWYRDFAPVSDEQVGELLRGELGAGR